MKLRLPRVGESVRFPRTLGPIELGSERCVYLNVHAKHPYNASLEWKIGQKRIEMGLERMPDGVVVTDCTFSGRATGGIQFWGNSLG